MNKCNINANYLRIIIERIKKKITRKVEYFSNFTNNYDCLRKVFIKNPNMTSGAAVPNPTAVITMINDHLYISQHSSQKGEEKKVRIKQMC